jgi:predicted amidohydrolase YtcJ
MAVGRNDDILALAGATTQRINAGGRLALPGLTDAHIHFLQYAIRRHQVSLFGVRDFAEVRRRVQTAVSRATPGQWVQGWGWDENLWPVPPTAAHLDDIAPHNPVVLARMDMHTWWVNSTVLQRANITRHTPDPIESKIERDEAGEPTGLLREWNAIALVERFIPQPDAATLTVWLKAAIAEAHQLGVTAIHDQRVEREGQQTFRLLQSLWRRDELNLRVHINIAADYLVEATILGLQPGFGDDRLWLGHVKAFADGTMGSRTALMLEPFEGEPDNYGLTVTPADELWRLAVQASEAGFSLSIHAIGDRAVREALDVLAERQPADVAAGLLLPHRIEHVQLIQPDDVGRLSHSGIVASLQPVHLLTDWPTADRVWGQRARYAYAFRSLLAKGTHLAFGSDAPVAPFNPMLGIYAAVTRQDEQGKPDGGWYPEEQLSVAEAIHGYTKGPAYVAGKQQFQGSITPGKWGDIILLSHDLFTLPAADIPQTTVALTIFAGQVVHQK